MIFWLFFFFQTLACRGRRVRSCKNRLAPSPSFARWVRVVNRSVCASLCVCVCVCG